MIAVRVAAAEVSEEIRTIVKLDFNKLNNNVTTTKKIKIQKTLRRPPTQIL